MKLRVLNSFSIILVGILFLLFWKEPGFWISFSLLVLSYLIILSFGIFKLSLNFFAPAITSGDADTIYLTYDDGPDAEHTSSILAFLKEEEVAASFFVIGSKVEENPQTMSEIAGGNHFIGNHSFSHAPLFQFWKTKRVFEDLKKSADTIAVYQHPSRKAFRPPIGIMNPNIAKAALLVRTAIIGWNNRTLDTTTTDVEKLWRRTKRKLEKGKTIVLLHDNRPKALQLTKRIVQWGKENGMKFDTVEHLINELT